MFRFRFKKDIKDSGIDDEAKVKVLADDNEEDNNCSAAESSPSKKIQSELEEISGETDDKSHLIKQLVEYYNTLDDLHKKLNDVKEKNEKLKHENQLLESYMTNLVSASSVMQPLKKF